MNIERIKKLQNFLECPLLIKKKENLFYLTGRSFMHGYLLVKPQERAKRLGLSAKSKSLSARRLALSSSVVFFGDGLEKVEGFKFDRLKNIGQYLENNKILQLENEFTFAEYNYLRAKRKGLRAKFKIEHAKSPVDYQRQIKEPGEISLIKKSMQIVEEVFYLVQKKLHKCGRSRPAPTEAELAAFIKSAGLKLGATDVSFPPIVACGANAAIPHHVPSSKKLKAGESIIIDFGFKYKNYCSDFTRTIFLKSVPKKLEEAYNQVEKAYEGAMDYCNLSALSQAQGISPEEGRKLQTAVSLSSSASEEERGRGEVVIKAGVIYQKAVDVLAEKKLDKYFIHSLGHGTGLEIHELPNLSPKSKDVLQNGMVFSIEPGVYMPKLGGIRIEDLVYLSEGKVKKFINVSTKLTENIL